MRYVFFKKFAKISDAVLELISRSKKLHDSELYLFNCENPTELEREYLALDDCNFTVIADFKVEDDNFEFEFSTNDHNHKVKLIGDRYSTFTTYSFTEDSSIRNSAVCQALLFAGWQPESIDHEAQAALETKEDETLKQAFRESVENGELLVDFDVSFSKDNISEVNIIKINTNPKQDLQALTLLPELKPAVAQIALRELGRIFIPPKICKIGYNVVFYDQNPLISDFKTYQDSLRKILAACDVNAS